MKRWFSEVSMDDVIILGMIAPSASGFGVCVDLLQDQISAESLASLRLLVETSVLSGVVLFLAVFGIVTIRLFVRVTQVAAESLPVDPGVNALLGDIEERHALLARKDKQAADSWRKKQLLGSLLPIVRTWLLAMVIRVRSLFRVR